MTHSHTHTEFNDPYLVFYGFCEGRQKEFEKDGLPWQLRFLNFTSSFHVVGQLGPFDAKTIRTDNESNPHGMDVVGLAPVTSVYNGIQMLHTHSDGWLTNRQLYQQRQVLNLKMFWYRSIEITSAD